MFIELEQSSGSRFEQCRRLQVYPANADFLVTFTTSAIRQISFSPWQTMANIPPEIWFQIAKFIPNEDVCDLLGVNRVFFNIAMDIRYREIMIGTRTPDQDIKTLKRIRWCHFAYEIRIAWPVNVSLVIPS